MRAEARARLLAAIAKARLWLDGLIAGTSPCFAVRGASPMSHRVGRRHMLLNCDYGRARAFRFQS
jgi:hypothetical protein